MRQPSRILPLRKWLLILYRLEREEDTDHENKESPTAWSAEDWEYLKGLTRAEVIEN